MLLSSFHCLDNGTKEDEDEGDEDDGDEDEKTGSTTAAKKKKKKSNKKKKRVKQTEPPTIPVSTIFPSKIYPEGELSEYKNE